MNDLRPRLGVRGVRPQPVLIAAGGWLATAALAGVTLPYVLGPESGGESIDTGVVVLMMAPLLVTARILIEQPAGLVLTAARPLWRDRLAWAGVYLGQGLAGAALAGAACPAPLVHVTVVGALLAGLILLGYAALGPERGWLPTAIVVGVFSAPGAVPWRYNLLYSSALIPRLCVIALVAASLALAAYAMRGTQPRQW